MRRAALLLPILVSCHTSLDVTPSSSALPDVVLACTQPSLRMTADWGDTLTAFGPVEVACEHLENSTDDCDGQFHRQVKIASGDEFRIRAIGRGPAQLCSGSAHPGSCTFAGIAGRCLTIDAACPDTEFFTRWEGNGDEAPASRVQPVTCRFKDHRWDCGGFELRTWTNTAVEVVRSENVLKPAPDKDGDLTLGDAKGLTIVRPFKEPEATLQNGSCSASLETLLCAGDSFTTPVRGQCQIPSKATLLVVRYVFDAKDDSCEWPTTEPVSPSH